MPVFRYATVEGTEGTIEASDYREAVSILRNERKIVTSLEEERGRVETVHFSPLDYLSIVRSGDIVLLFRQLATLIKSGITLSAAISILEGQAKRRLRKVLRQIRLDIERGSSFNEALKRHKRLFSPTVIGLVSAGEESGMFDIVLERIATHLEDRAAFRSHVITSMIYPTVVVIMSIIVIAFLVGFVIPKFVPLLTSMGAKLPWNTQLLVDVTNWTKKYWKHALVTVIGFVSINILLYKTIKPIRYWADRLKLKPPVIGAIFRYSLIVRFTRNLATLIKSGLGMVESLRITRGVLGNEAAKDAIGMMERRILRGESFSEPLKSAGYVFPRIVADMVAVGEETGNMDTVLDTVGEIYEKMFQSYVKRMCNIIEPVLILWLGSIVGFVAWSLISGVLAMYSAFGAR